MNRFFSSARSATNCRPGRIRWNCHLPGSCLRGELPTTLHPPLYDRPLPSAYICSALGHELTPPGTRHRSYVALLPPVHTRTLRTVNQTVDLISPENGCEDREVVAAGVVRCRTNCGLTHTIVRAIGIQTSPHPTILLRTHQLLHFACFNRFIHPGICRRRSDKLRSVDVRIIACGCSEHGILCGETHCEMEGSHPWTNCDPRYRVGPHFGIWICFISKCA